MSKNAPEILLLRQAIETSVNRPIRTPTDFDFLVGAIWERIHMHISSTTLKRLWGYIDGADVTRPSTLDLLAKFLGFDHWDLFVADAAAKSVVESDVLLGDGLRSSRVAVGDLVQVAWLPNRRCTFRCIGRDQFEVVEAENSKLHVGDRFECTLFLLHEPLYIDNLVQQRHAPVSFVCGNKNGLTEVHHLPQR
ncbi:MAG: hypothetical protein ACI30H_07650 [Paludibacteraceae bacterium]